MMADKGLVPIELIQSRIIVLRDEKVMIDRDIAELYGVSTKALNQAVTRNVKRFPPDFMFRVTRTEKEQLVTNCDLFGPLKHSSAMPRAFTEQGMPVLLGVERPEGPITLLGQDRQDSQDFPGANSHRSGHMTIRPSADRLL